MTLQQTALEITSEAIATSDRLYRRIAWSLLPLLLLCYIVAMIDRLNVGYAKLQFVTDLHFDEGIFGVAAGALYVGYILFEVPSNLLLARVGIRVTLLRIMTLWGVFTMALAFAHTRYDFYGLRFLVGAAEAGFFPGVVLYVTYWFPNRYRGRVIALFAMGVPLSGVIAGPLSTWIMVHLAGVAGLRGWQWLFILEGAPALVLGAAAYHLLADRPATARFLSAQEKLMVEADLAADVDARSGRAAPRGFAQALRTPRVYALAIVYFAFYSMQSVLLIWVPTLLKSAGVTDLAAIGWRASAIALVGAVGMAAIGISSDRLEERRWHLIGCGSIAALAFALLQTGDADHVTLLLMVASIAMFGFLGVFWTIPTAFLGPEASAGGIALISAIGASGSALSPVFIGWMKLWTGSFFGAVDMLAVLFFASMVVLYRCIPTQPITVTANDARPEEPMVASR